MNFTQLLEKLFFIVTSFELRIEKKKYAAVQKLIPHLVQFKIDFIDWYLFEV